MRTKPIARSRIGASPLGSGREIDFPEVRRRPQECKSNVLLTTFQGPHVGNPALLLFLRCLVNDQKGFTQSNPSGESDQAAVRIYQVRRCFFAISACCSILPVNSHWYPQI